MINKWIGLGNVGKDPDIKTLENGNKLASFSLATSEKYKNKKGEQVEDTTWHNIVMWGNLAGIVEKYVKKGDKLYLEGKINVRSYENKEGQKVWVTDIVCNNMQMLGGNNTNTTQSAPQESEANSIGEPDDLPF